MTSKLASLARVVFASKAAAIAARTAPAAIVGPLQRIFGNSKEEEEEEQQNQDENGVVLESSAVNNEESNESAMSTTTTTNGVFSALVARAEASATASSSTTTSTTGIAAVASNPFAKRELREFQQDYYRRSIASAQKAATDLASRQQPDPVEDLELSIPVGDEYLYLAQ